MSVIFHPLRVRSVQPDTSEAVVVTFEVPEDLRPVFGFTQGQYLTLRRAPAWTTDWISDEGKRKLREYGIAPPGPTAEAPIRLVRKAPQPVACPRCGSIDTERLSAFGSTACKSMYRCVACREPFEYFKPL